MASPIDQLRARLAFVRNQARNLRPAVTKIGQDWRADRKTDFQTQGATTSHGVWDANKASTIKRKGHSRVLRGIPSKGFQLFNSIVKMRHKDHIFNWHQGGTTIELGTKDPKAHRHQFGRGVPVRRPIDPTLAQRQGYAGRISSWLFQGKVS